jgi:hypothetical protein
MPILAGPEQTGTPAVTTAGELDAPPENTDLPPENTEPEETDVPPLDVGTQEEIQAMLEQPTGVHVVEDGSGGFTTIETAPATEPGVDTRWMLPEVLQEDKRVLSSGTGAETAGVR